MEAEDIFIVDVAIASVDIVGGTKSTRGRQ
jgi:hypothetical protein